MNPEVGILIIVAASALSYPIVCAISCAVQSARRSSHHDSLAASTAIDSVGWGI